MVGSVAGQVAAGLMLGAGLVARGREHVQPAQPAEAVRCRHVPQRRGAAGGNHRASFAAAAFAFLTEELARHGVVEFTAADGSGVIVLTPDPDSLYWFYGWHLLDALPASPLSTLKIDAPYDYAQARVGALLLVYTLLVVTPFISLVTYDVIRQRRHHAAPVVASSAKRPAPVLTSRPGLAPPPRSPAEPTVLREDQRCHPPNGHDYGCGASPSRLHQTWPQPNPVLSASIRRVLRPAAFWPRVRRPSKLPDLAHRM